MCPCTKLPDDPVIILLLYVLLVPVYLEIVQIVKADDKAPDVKLITLLVVPETEYTGLLAPNPDTYVFVKVPVQVAFLPLPDKSTHSFVDVLNEDAS